MKAKSQKHDCKILTVIHEYLLYYDINSVDELISQCALNSASIWGELALSVLGENSLQNSKLIKEKIVKSKKLQSQIENIIQVIVKKSKFNILIYDFND
jgi:hypothetical protein